MNTDLRHDLETIVEFGPIAAVGIGAGIGVILGTLARDMKNVKDYCNKHKIEDRAKCKAKYRISMIQKNMKLVKDGLKDCPNQKNPQKCVVMFKNLERKFQERIKKYENKAR